MSFISNSVPIHFYQVRTADEGKTLSVISEKFGVTPADIQKETPGDVLQPGEILVINLQGQTRAFRA